MISLIGWYISDLAQSILLWLFPDCSLLAKIELVRCSLWDAGSYRSTQQQCIKKKKRLDGLVFTDIQWFNLSPCCSEVQVHSRTVWHQCWVWSEMKLALNFQSVRAVIRAVLSYSLRKQSRDHDHAFPLLPTQYLHTQTHTHTHILLFQP